MIDPAQGVKKQAADPPVPHPARVDNAREREGAAPGRPEVKVAERQKQVPSSDPVIDVHLDGETMRLYTELRDPETDRVLLRLPAAYQNEQEATPMPGTSVEA
jgi:hypothetical protein